MATLARVFLPTQRPTTAPPLHPTLAARTREQAPTRAPLTRA